jgi:Arc/MetJ family transcription regulator
VADRRLTEPLNRRVADRRGIGFGWLLQNAWLLHARLKIHRGGV